MKDKLLRIGQMIVDWCPLVLIPAGGVYFIAHGVIWAFHRFHVAGR